MVAGTYSARSVSTGRWVCSEMPRFPCSRFLRYTQVLHRQRLVEPVLMPEGLHRGRVADGALAEVGGGGVTGD